MAAELSRLIHLLRERSYERRNVVLASGRVSDFYVDGKQTSLHAEGAWLLGNLFWERLDPGVVAVGGLTLGADPIVAAIAAVSFHRGRPVDAFIVRKEPKGHGTGQWIEGRKLLPDGARVAIVEDTTTTGASLLKAVDRAAEAGLRVVQTLTIVDREEGAADALAARGFHLDSLVRRRDLEG